jgi:hypothetical protein
MKKNMKNMAKKHAPLAFFHRYLFAVLCLSHITNCRTKKMARSTSNVSKNGKKKPFHVLYLFFVGKKI